MGSVETVSYTHLLREFARRADRNEPIEMAMQSAFPHNELGEISQHIIPVSYTHLDVYKRQGPKEEEAENGKDI